MIQLSLKDQTVTLSVSLSGYLWEFNHNRSTCGDAANLHALVKQQMDEDRKRDEERHQFKDRRIEELKRSNAMTVPREELADLLEKQNNEIADLRKRNLSDPLLAATFKPLQEELAAARAEVADLREALDSISRTCCIIDAHLISKAALEVAKSPLAERLGLDVILATEPGFFASAKRPSSPQKA